MKTFLRQRTRRKVKMPNSSTSICDLHITAFSDYFQSVKHHNFDVDELHEYSYNERMPRLSSEKHMKLISIFHRCLFFFRHKESDITLAYADHLRTCK